MIKPRPYPWHVIRAGGMPRTVYIDGAFLTPYFNSHESCQLWWTKHCKRTNEPSPWAITEAEWSNP